MKRTFSIAFLVILLFSFLPAQTRRLGRTRTFEATAYAQHAKSFGKKVVEVNVLRWGAAPGSPPAP